MSAIKLALGAAATAVFATGAPAATVDLFAQAAATNMTAGSIPSDSDFDESSFVASPVSAATSATASESGTSGSGTSTTTISADISTGVLSGTVDADIQLSPGVPRGPGVSGFGRATISETFSLTGTGEFIVSMLVDASWNNLDNWGGVSWVQIGAITALDSQVLSTAGFGTSGSVNDVFLSASTSAVNANAVLVDVIWGLDFRKLDGPNDGDLSRFNTIWFETTGTLVATPSDPNFLSNALYPLDLADGPAVIPLPAGIWLALTGILGLGVLRRAKPA